MFGHEPSTCGPEGSCGLPLLLGLVQGQGVYDRQKDMGPIWLGHVALGSACNDIFWDHDEGL